MAYFHCTIVIILSSLPCLTFSVQPPIEIKPYIIDYRNGTVLRDTVTNPPSFVPPPNNPHIQSKDISINPSLRARIFIPARPDLDRKIPILVYFHGGAFCIGSAFSESDTLFLARLTARANVVAVAVDYRLYPDSWIPAPYDDAWAALQWVFNQRPGRPGSDPWLARYGDFHRVYAGGDSAGGNIAHNLAIRAGPGPMLRGLVLAMPYFLGSERVPLEPVTITESPNYKIWAYVCPNCKGGVNNGYINPIGPDGPRLSGLGCERLLVYTAELDELRGRDRCYYERVKRSGWKGEARWVEARGKGHVFHILKPEDPATARLIQDFSAFLNA